MGCCSTLLGGAADPSSKEARVGGVDLAERCRPKALFFSSRAARARLVMFRGHCLCFALPSACESLPVGWLVADVGTVGAVGSECYISSTGTYQVTGFSGMNFSPFK